MAEQPVSVRPAFHRPLSFLREAGGDKVAARARFDHRSDDAMDRVGALRHLARTMSRSRIAALSAESSSIPSSPGGAGGNSACQGDSLPSEESPASVAVSRSPLGMLVSAEVPSCFRLPLRVSVPVRGALIPRSFVVFDVTTHTFSGTAHAQGSQAPTYSWRISGASHAELAAGTSWLADANKATATYSVPRRKQVTDRRAASTWRFACTVWRPMPRTTTTNGASRARYGWRRAMAGPVGSERLWMQPDAAGLAANDDAPLSSRLDAELGYGMALFGGGFTGTPNVGFGLSDTAREIRMGWRLNAAAGGFELSFDATRREDDAGAEHGIGARLTTRW